MLFVLKKAHHSNERPPKYDRSLNWLLVFILAKLLYKAQWYAGKELICIESEESIETELSFSESTENSEYLRSQKILERGLSKRENLINRRTVGTTGIPLGIENVHHVLNHLFLGSHIGTVH